MSDTTEQKLDQLIQKISQLEQAMAAGHGADGTANHED
jgi:hypothetical protein